MMKQKTKEFHLASGQATSLSIVDLFICYSNLYKLSTSNPNQLAMGWVDGKK